MLTQEQKDTLRAKYNIGVYSSEEQSKTGFLQNVKNDILKRGSNIKEIAVRGMEGKLDPIQSGLQTVGNIAGIGSDLIGEGAKSLYKTVLPDDLQESNKQAAGYLLQTKIGKGFLSAVSKGLEAYQAMAEKYPNAAKDFEAVVNIAEIFPILKGGTSAIKGGSSLVKTGVKQGAANIKKTVKGGLEKIADSDFITPVEEGVKTELKKSVPAELNKYVEIAKAGAIDYSKPSALDVVGEKAGEVVKSLKGKLRAIGEKKSALTSAIGEKETGKIVYNTRLKLRDLMEERAGATFDKAKNIVSSSGRSVKISEAEGKFLKWADNKLASISTNFNVPTFQKVDDVIDAIQAELYAQKSNMLIPSKSNVDSIVENITSSLNKELRTIGGASYQSANDSYRVYKTVYDKLNKLMGAEGKNGGAIMKRVFSPSDARTKKLFNEIKRLTGVDLIKEATLAKYAMEKIGDARSSSLLEQINIIKSSLGGGKLGAIEKAANYILDKARNPIRKANKIMTK